MKANLEFSHYELECKSKDIWEFVDVYKSIDEAKADKTQLEHEEPDYTYRIVEMFKREVE